MKKNANRSGTGVPPVSSHPQNSGAGVPPVSSHPQNSGTGVPPVSTHQQETHGQDARATTETEPYPGYAAEKAAMDRKLAEARAGRTAPLPGPLREAFAGAPLVVGGFTFQPVCAWLVAILARIDSPILEIVRIYREFADDLQAASGDDEAGKALRAVEKKINARITQEIKPGPDTVIETVFAFVTPVEECQALLDNQRKEYTHAARQKLGKLHPTALADLERACGRHYFASFTTALRIQPEPTDPARGDGTMVFPQPPAERKTASAGGSKLLAP